MLQVAAPPINSFELIISQAIMQQSSTKPITKDRYCIHQVTLMEQCNFRQSIECLARNDIGKTAVWKHKLAELDTSEANHILRDHGVLPHALCAGVLLGDTLPDSRPFPLSPEQRLDDLLRLLEQAVAISSPTIVLITGGLAGYGRDLVRARNDALETLAAFVPYAKAAKVSLSLEPLHPMVCGNRSVISTLSEANDFLNALGLDEHHNDHVGIALDSYALWWQSDLKDQISNTAQRIHHFHVSDWLADTRDIRLDRGMPGDGLIDNRRIRHWLEEAGFNGAIEVEIFSRENWWKKPPDDVVQTIVGRYKTAL